MYLVFFSARRTGSTSSPGRAKIRRVLYTGPHTTALARWTPILKDFCRRVSPPTPRVQSPSSVPFNSTPTFACIALTLRCLESSTVQADATARPPRQSFRARADPASPPLASIALALSTRANTSANVRTSPTAPPRARAMMASASLARGVSMPPRETTTTTTTTSRRRRRVAARATASSETTTVPALEKVRARLS